jgi:hypothetical protein
MNTLARTDKRNDVDPQGVLANFFAPVADLPQTVSANYLLLRPEPDSWTLLKTSPFGRISDSLCVAG